MTANPIKQYVDTKIEVTKCLQKHFKQLCYRCPKYAKCDLYESYCDCWAVLQEVAKLPPETLPTKEIF